MHDGTPSGHSESRRTAIISVIDCTVVKMSTGINTYLASGSKYLEGCIVLDSGQSGYRPGGNSTLVNCKGNATYGALLDLTGTGSKGVKNASADLTLLQETDLDISQVVAYLVGKNHTISLHSEGTFMPTGIAEIRVGGSRPTWRHPLGELINIADNVTFNNYTAYPVVLAPSAVACQVMSVGPIEDLGEGNRTGSLFVQGQ